MSASGEEVIRAYFGSRYGNGAPVRLDRFLALVKEIEQDYAQDHPRLRDHVIDRLADLEDIGVSWRKNFWNLFGNPQYKAAGVKPPDENVSGYRDTPPLPRAANLRRV